MEHVISHGRNKVMDVDRSNAPFRVASDDICPEITYTTARSLERGYAHSGTTRPRYLQRQAGDTFYPKEKHQVKQTGRGVLFHEARSDPTFTHLTIL